MKKTKSIPILAILGLVLSMVVPGCKTTSPQPGEERESMSLRYRTITEGFDWGPAITKLVLETGTAVDPDSLLPELFEVQSVRTFRDFNFSTFELASEATAHRVSRPVIKVYPSDAEGNRQKRGHYITLEMPVGPTLPESSPFNYDMTTNLNNFIEIYHTVSLKEGAQLRTSKGAAFTFHPSGKEENDGAINLIADDFLNDQKFSYKDIELTYAGFIPEKASKKAGSNPLIIWLHGAGEGGANTRIVLLGNKVVSLASDTVQKHFGKTGAYVLTPQSPTMWMDYDGTGTYNDKVPGSQGKSYYTEALMALIDHYVSEHPEIDRNRIYLGGCSNGGYMTVNMISTYPDYFAAAYPICEAYSAEWIRDEQINAIKEIPIWLTHAANDPVVVIGKGTPANGEGGNFYTFEYDEEGKIIMIDDFSNALYSRLVSAGAQNVYYTVLDKVEDKTGLYFAEDGVTPYEYFGHFAWVPALNDQCVENIDGKEVSLFQWLAGQSKK